MMAFPSLKAISHLWRIHPERDVYVAICRINWSFHELLLP